MTTLSRSMLRCIIFITLCLNILHAQNADVNAERMCDDLLFLKSIQGNAPIGAYSVSPVPLSTMKKVTVSASDATVRAIHDEIRNYYAPFMSDDSVSSSVWFETVDHRVHVLDVHEKNLRLQCDGGGMLRPGSVRIADHTESFLMGNLNARAIGELSDNLGFALYLSNGVLFKGDQAYVKQTDPILSRTLKFTELEQKYFDRYIGYVQYQSDILRVRFGRESFSWGYSPIDNLVHSRYAPLTDGLLIDVPFHSIRFSSVHMSVDGFDIQGKPLLNKFIASHRLQIEATSWLSVGINDMLVYSGRGVDFAYLNPLAFYVSTGLGSRDRSEQDNSLIGLDFALRVQAGTMMYGSLLIDDLSFSSLSDTTAAGNNNKNAVQLGLSQLVHISDKSLLFSAEYVRISPFTYAHRQVNNSWTHAGAPLGYNMQPNSDRLALQAKYWINGRSYVQVDVDYTRWGENLLDSLGHIRTIRFVTGSGDTVQLPIGNVGGDMTRGDGDFLPAPFDVGNRFLRGNVSTTRRCQVLVSTELRPNIYLDARALYQNRSGGNAPGEQLWFSVELRVGY